MEPPALQAFFSLGRDFPRLLLAILAGLLAMRPLVVGEDPGLLSPRSHPVAMLLTLAWFVTAILWALHRSWTGSRELHGGGVEWGLVAVGGVQLLSTLIAAEYKQPAMTIAWEWFGYAVVYFLVRNLARTPEEVHGLMAVILAGAVSLSVQSGFQSLAELPQLKRRLDERPRTIDEVLPQQFVHVETDDFLLQQRLQGIQQHRAAGTFIDPDQFSGLLLLCLPAAVALTYLAWRRRTSATLTIALLVSTIVILSGVIVARSWSSLWALLAVGAVVGWLLPLDRTRRLSIAAGCLVCGAVVWLIFPIQEEMRDRALLWKAAWSISQKHSVNGVGAGNFGRHLGQHREALPTSLGVEETPCNALLEMKCSAGWTGLLAFLALVGWFGRRVYCGWRAGGESEPSSSETAGTAGSTSTTRSPRWEFYIGGMVGLVVGFVLRATALPADEMLAEGWQSGLRSLIWFLAFAVFYSAGIGQRVQNLVCFAGVAALLLQQMFNSGIQSPSLGHVFWAMAALAMNSLPRPIPPQISTSPVTVHLPLPIAVGIALVYFINVFLPIYHSALLVSEARRHYAAWNGSVDREWRKTFRSDGGNTDTLAGLDARARDRHRAVEEARKYLIERILTPLLKAIEVNPGDAYAHCELAFWYRKAWELSVSDADQLQDARLILAVNGKALSVAIKDAEDKAKKGKKEPVRYPDEVLEEEAAESYAKVLFTVGTPEAHDKKKGGARGLDPRGKASFHAEADFRIELADHLVSSAQRYKKRAEKASDLWKPDYLKLVSGNEAQARKEYEKAQEVLQQLLEFDPTNRKANDRLKEIAEKVKTLPSP